MSLSLSLLKSGAVLFLKGGRGSGNHGHRGRSGQVGGSAPTDGLPPSTHIKTIERARAYWREHFGGKTLAVTIHSGGREIPIRARFGDGELHAFTRKARLGEEPDAYDDERRKRGPRKFDQKRAKCLDKILSTISHPDARSVNYGADILFERVIEGAHFLVAINWKDSAGVYEFDSSYHVTPAEKARLLRQRDRRKNNGPLQKGGGPFSSAPSVLREAQPPVGSTPPATGSQPVADSPIGFCRGCADSVIHALLAGKGIAVPDDAVDITVWLGDEPELGHILKATPTGARWITVHPNGRDEKGVPVMIQETKHGSGVYHVIGGAGGKLNYLKLRGVKSEHEYRQEAGERQKARREQRKQQRERDKAAGTYEAKQQARQAVSDQRREHEAKFIETVSGAMGWDPKEVAFQAEAYANVSPEARKQAEAKHHGEILRRANEAVEAQRARLLVDADARAEVLGEIPLESADPGTIAVEDLDPVSPQPAGLGYATDYKGRAEARGLTEQALESEAGALRERRLAELPPEQQEAARARSERAQRIRRELETVRAPEPKTGTKLADAKQAVALLRAQKELKLVQKKARAAAAEIDQAVEPRAYVIEVGKDGLDESVMEDLENDLRTARTRAFLAEAAKQGTDYEKTLARHLGAGAYNSLNALSLTAAGAGLVDRDVVDVMGIAGAAQVLARRLHADMTPDEVAEIARALEQYHLDHYLDASEESLREAMEWQAVANEIDAGQAVDGHDLARAQELNAKRRDAVANAQRALGTALGEMEANAALIVALKQGAKDSTEVSLGHISAEGAIRQARAIGLERGDYQIHAVGANRFLAVSGAGMDRLAKPVDRESLAATREALAIIDGQRDEDDWLPMGVANRPDLAVHTPAGAAPRLAEPFAPGPDLERAVRDYIGGRTADGDPPADILADLLAESTMQQVGDRRAEFVAALDQVAPMRGADGKPVRAESHQAAFEALADQYVSDRYGAGRQPLHRQHVVTDQVTVDALHRALAAEPTGIAAFKAAGDLTVHDQGALRAFFSAHVAKPDDRAIGLRAELEEIEKSEPERETDDMFGRGTNPMWVAWKGRRDAKAAEVNAAGFGWAKYVDVMGDPTKAYAAIQDLVRSKVVKEFHQAHNTLRADAPLKLGRTVIAGNLDHLDAVDPEARDRRLAEQRALIDGLRNRDQGRYAAGSVTDKVAASREQMEALAQSQMGFFAAAPEAESETARELGKDERYTLGHAAERQIAGLMGRVGENFKPGRPTKLWSASMNGKYIMQQRAIKLIDHSKRVVLAHGVGSGKTVSGLGAFTHLHGQGKVKKGIFAVPSIVQGQFGGEALRYLEPGKFKWHAVPGAPRDERIRAYKDPSTHFAVVTHQSLRDDLLHMGAARAGVTETALAEQLDAMDPAARRAWAKELMEAEEINPDFLMIDEGHDLLNRAGKANSILANVVDAVSAHVPYYVSASADPIKNDPSEAFDLLSKMAPDRYTDRAAFMRRYGVDTVAARDGLRREMARHFYPGRIDPGVAAEKSEVQVPLSDGQRGAIEDVDHMLARARLAHMNQRVDVEAMRAIAPSSFAGVAPERHEAVAKELQGNLGILKQTAVQRVIDTHQDNAKVSHLAGIVRERAGQPGVVFAHSLEAVRQISERLKRDGHRIVTLTGADSAKDKESKKLAFRPESGEASADIIVCSDAGAVGANLQRGRWLVQFDTPNTAKTHAQRAGRIHRLGQKNNVELIDLVADHPAERAARKRLATKYGLREVLTSPLDGLDDTGLAGYLARARAEREQRLVT